MEKGFSRMPRSGVRHVFTTQKKRPSFEERFLFKSLVRQAGFEPTTLWFVARYSIQLSYCRSVRIRILSGIPSDVKSPKEKYHEEGMTPAGGSRSTVHGPHGRHAAGRLGKTPELQGGWNDSGCYNGRIVPPEQQRQTIGSSASETPRIHVPNTRDNRPKCKKPIPSSSSRP